MCECTCKCNCVSRLGVELGLCAHCKLRAYECGCINNDEDECLFTDSFELILRCGPGLTLLVAFVVTVWVSPELALDVLLLDMSALGEFLLLMAFLLIPTALCMISGMFIFACAGYGLAAVFVLLKWTFSLLMQGYSWAVRWAEQR